MTASWDDGAAADEIAAVELGRLAEATEVGTGTVERLELAVDELAIAYPSTPSADLYGRVRGYLRYVGRLLDARMTLAEHRRLLVVGGWLSLLAATTLIDLHRDQAAAAHLRTAAQLARETGARRDRRVVPGNPGLAGAHRRGLPAGRGYLPGRPADRPEDGQRVHPGHRAGRTRLGQARCRRCRPAPR